MSIGSPEQTGLHQPERRKGKRPTTLKRVEVYQDWLHRLDELVKAGKIARIERNHRVARALVAAQYRRERAHEKASKDPLTGLNNRGVFEKSYEALVKRRLPFGLLIIDIDHFKRVNDTYGHQAGDAVLIQTGMEIENNIRQLRPNNQQNDIVARYGGEEIAVLLPNVSGELDLRAIAENIRDAIGCRPFSARGREIPITVSIGGGIFRGQDKGEFFQAVDKQALYGAKESGRNRTVILGANPH
ncbi:GGDEF domain-containing protein [Patescibacteria group bacterium]|nr:GGDEF domain-containing protein [Patescibacteria group bacterium]